MLSSTYQSKISNLKLIRGMHTSLISLYVPSNRNKIDVIAYLRNEITESINIRDKNNRKAVLGAIQRIIEWIKKTPHYERNGVAIFSTLDKLEIISPIKPITHFYYTCGSEFYLEPLMSNYGNGPLIGVLVMDHREASIGWLQDTRLELICILESGIEGKHGQGGQSQNRFMRLHAEMEYYFYKQIAEKANKTLLDLPRLDGLLIGGSGNAKNAFLKAMLLDYRIRRLTPIVVETGYTDWSGMREAVYKAEDKLSSIAYIRDKKLVDSFMIDLMKGSRLVVYGERIIEDLIPQYKLQRIAITDKKVNMMISSITAAEKIGVEIIVLIKGTESYELIQNTFGGIIGWLRYE